MKKKFDNPEEIVENKMRFLRQMEDAVVSLDTHRFESYVQMGVFLFGTKELEQMIRKQLPLKLGGYYTKRLILMMEHTLEMEEERRR